MSRPSVTAIENIADLVVEKWLQVHELIIHPKGFGEQAERLRPALFLQRQSTTVEEDLEKSSGWYFTIATRVNALNRVVKSVERAKTTMLAELVDAARQEAADRNEKITDKGAEAKARSHQEYAPVCADLIRAEAERDDLVSLLAAVDRRIDTLRTIAANMRRSQEIAAARPGHGPGGN